MLKDLTRSDWLGILNLPESRVPGVFILRGTRNFRVQYDVMRSRFENPIDLGAPNGVIEDVLIGDLMGRPVGFACVYGGSMASEIVHIFGVLGCRAVIQIGNCGGLADSLHTGDIFVATKAFCGEGAAQYYKTDGPWVEASRTLLNSQSLLRLQSGGFVSGSIYSTGALFAEGMDDVERWAVQGFGAVDMETAATFAVAESFQMNRISVLYVFDNPRRRDHMLQSDVQKNELRASANEKVVNLSLELASEILNSMDQVGKLKS